MSVRSLRLRMALVLAAAIVPLAALLVHAYQAERERALRQLEGDLRVYLRWAVERHDDVGKRAQQLLRIMGRSDDVVRLDSAECGGIAGRLLETHDAFVALGGVDEAGRLVCQAGRGPGDTAGSPWFLHARAVGSFTGGHWNPQNSTLTFAMPLSRADGRGNGVLFATSGLHWMERLVADMRLPAGWAAVVFDRQSNILARYPDSARWVGKRLPDPGLASRASGHRWEGANELVVRETGPDGVRRQYLVAPLSSAGGDLFLAIGGEQGLAVAEIEEHFHYRLLGLALAAALSGLLAWSGVRRSVLGWVSSAEGFARRVGQGDFSARLPPAGASELDAVGQAMERMAAEIQARERARSADELRLKESELRLRLGLSATGQGLFDVHFGSGRIYRSAETFAVLGHAPDARWETTDEWLDCVHPADRERVAAAYARCRSGESTEYRVELRAATAAGGWRWLLSQGAVVERDPRGEPLRMLGTITDVDALKRAEQRVERLSGLYATLLAANQLMIRCVDEAQLYRDMCQALVLHGFRLAWIAESDPRAGKAVAAAWAGTSGQHGEQRPCIALDPAAEDPVNVALREGRTLICDEVCAMPPGAPGHEEALRAGARHCAAIPFQRGGAVAGCLTLYADDPDWFAEDILALLHQLAADLSYALDHLDSRRSRDQALDRMSETAGQLSAVLDASPTPVVTLDPQGRVASWNRAAGRVFGWPSAEVTGRPLPLLAESERARFDGLLQAVQGRQSFSDADFAGRSRDGAALDLAMSAAPIVGPGGGVRGAVLVISNISPRRAAERALAQREALFRAMFEQAAVGMAQTDRSLVVTRCNRRFAQLVGRSEEILGRSFLEIARAEDPAPRLSLVERLGRGECDGGTVEECYRQPDGGAVWVLLSLSAVRDAQGRVDFHVAVLEDITALKRVEQALAGLNSELEERVRRRTDDLEQANRDLESFSYSVSHDLRAPLRAISGFSHIVAERCAGQMDEESRGYLSRVAGAAARMNELIEDLLAFSRIGRKPVQAVPSSLKDAVADVLGDLAPRIAEEGAEVSVDPALPPVLAEGTLLRQVLTNLVGNALTYHSKDTRPRITIDAKREDGSVVLRVADNGIGIAPAYHEQVFEAFKRLHGGGAYPGTGIGLAIVRKAVGLLGGSVWVESEEGAGASFFVRLPAG